MEMTFMSEEGGLVVHHDDDAATIDYEDGISYLIGRLAKEHNETLTRKREALKETPVEFGNPDAIRLLQEIAEQQAALDVLEEAEALIIERW